LGLIDTLASGFRLAQRKPWLLVLPVLADLWLWLGTHLSIKPLIDGILALWSPATLPPDFAAMAGPYQQMLSSAGDSFNLWWLLSNELTWLHLLIPGLDAPARFAPATPVTEVPTLALILWVPLLLLVALGLGSLFVTAVTSQLQAFRATPSPAERLPDSGEQAAQVQDQPGLGHWVRRGLRTWLMVSVYGLLVLALLILVILALSIVLTGVMLVAPSLSAGFGTLSVLLVGWVVIWFYLMLYFVVAALVVDGTSLPQALWRSANVTSRNFWATIGLVILTNLILGGFGFIWQRLAVLSPWGVLAGILGNAFLLTGLVATRLMFYRERYANWQATLAAQKATASPPAGS
jgi:hypothetical protein